MPLHLDQGYKDARTQGGVVANLECPAPSLVSIILIWNSNWFCHPPNHFRFAANFCLFFIFIIYIFARSLNEINWCENAIILLRVTCPVRTGVLYGWARIVYELFMAQRSTMQSSGHITSMMSSTFSCRRRQQRARSPQRSWQRLKNSLRWPAKFAILVGTLDHKLHIFHWFIPGFPLAFIFFPSFFLCVQEQEHHHLLHALR